MKRLKYEKKAPFISLLLDIWHLLVGGQRCGVQDRIAMQIAARHGKTEEYKKARRQNMRTLEVLDGWGLADEEEIKKFYD